MYKKILSIVCFGIVATNNSMHLFKSSGLLHAPFQSVGLLTVSSSISPTIMRLNKRYFSTGRRDKKSFAFQTKLLNKQETIVRDAIETSNLNYQKSFAKEFKALKILIFEQQLQILELRMTSLGADSNWQLKFDTQEIARLYIQKQAIEAQIAELNKR